MARARALADHNLYSWHECVEEVAASFLSDSYHVWKGGLDLENYEVEDVEDRSSQCEVSFVLLCNLAQDFM